MPDQTKNNTGNRGTRRNSVERKIFVSGIPPETSGVSLCAYFEQFGEVLNIRVMNKVKKARFSRKFRDFAFVEFKTLDGFHAALAFREHKYCSKTIKVKPAKMRENKEIRELPIVKTKKVFVGGLSIDITMTDICACFEPYGPIEKVEWPFSKFTKKRRSFLFIFFKEERYADMATVEPRQMVGNRECDVQKAIFQRKRHPGFRGGSQDGSKYKDPNSRNNYSAGHQRVQSQVYGACDRVQPSISRQSSKAKKKLRQQQDPQINVQSVPEQHSDSLLYWLRNEFDLPSRLERAKKSLKLGIHIPNPRFEAQKETMRSIRADIAVIERNLKILNQLK